MTSKAWGYFFMTYFIILAIFVFIIYLINRLIKVSSLLREVKNQLVELEEQKKISINYEKEVERINKIFDLQKPHNGMPADYVSSVLSGKTVGHD
jgi:hypothetical protein